MAFRTIPDLNKRYDATWALVAGAGSRIGKLLPFKLAPQILDVVLVFIDNNLLKTTMEDIQDTYPHLKFGSIGVTFSTSISYLKTIKDAMKDIDIPIVFGNAGFIFTGFIDPAPLYSSFSVCR